MNVHAFTWSPAPSARSQSAPARHIWLRVLETTDVHAHLMPFDYDRGIEVAGFGLARTATLIERARAEAANTLLFDNGDFLQGSALSDLGVGPDADWNGPHPVIAAMNQLDYTAACLGNHEFNFGLEWMMQALDQALFPVLCANALRCDTAGRPDEQATLLPPSLLLPCTLRNNLGQEETVQVGILGLMPPQVTTWDHIHLNGRITARGIVETAQREVPRLRAAGAQVVITLAHSGIAAVQQDAIDRDPGAEEPENVALALASVPGIDAVLAGHSHQVFPDPSSAPSLTGVDHTAGTLANVPTVMAGYRGSHLGVIDLCLAPRDQGWAVYDHRCEARPVHPDPAGCPVPPHAMIVDVVRTAHLATLNLTSHPVGHSAECLHSYLSQLRPCRTIAPVLAAKEAALKSALTDTPHAGLPVLAATAPFKTGGHAGPDYYVDIPPGPLTLGNLAELYPFPNTLIGLRLTGAEIADWLERAASCFHQIAPGHADTPQPLWNPEFAGHAFDTISGLDYIIDLSRPPRYDPKGTLINPDAHRIRNIRFAGAPLHETAEFAVATNNFRAFGGGPYEKAPRSRVIHEGRRPVRDHLSSFVRANGMIGGMTARHGWHLSGPSDAMLLVETGPGLNAHRGDLSAISARDLGLNPQGFARFAVPLAALGALANPGKTP